MAAGEVVEYLRLFQHREKFLLTLGRTAPAGGTYVIPRPSWRGYQVLAVEYPQPPVHGLYALYVLFLEVARYQHRKQLASLLPRTLGRSALVLLIAIRSRPNATLLRWTRRSI